MTKGWSLTLVAFVEHAIGRVAGQACVSLDFWRLEWNNGRGSLKGPSDGRIGVSGQLVFPIT